MPQDMLLADVKKLQAVVDRLSTLETPAPGRGLWAGRPTVPVADQEYTATDRNHESYFWFPGSPVGTNANWISTKVYEVELRPTAAAAQPQTYAVNTASTNRRAINNFKWSTSYVVDHAEMTIRQAATNDLTHYCSINFLTLSAALAGTAVIQISSNVAGKAVATNYNYVGGGSLATVYTTTTAPVWTTDIFLQGAGAGAVTVEGVSIWIRLVG